MCNGGSKDVCLLVPYKAQLVFKVHGTNTELLKAAPIYGLLPARGDMLIAVFYSGGSSTWSRRRRLSRGAAARRSRAKWREGREGRGPSRG